MWQFTCSLDHFMSVKEWASPDCRGPYWSPHVSAITPPRTPRLTCALEAQRIYSTAWLWCVSVAMVPQRWPLTRSRTEVCWWLSCKHTQQRPFQAQLFMDTVDLFLWTLHLLLFSDCILCCWSMTWYTRAASCLHSNAVKMWGKVPKHLCDCHTNTPVCLSLCLLCVFWNISKQDSVSINTGPVFTF